MSVKRHHWATAVALGALVTVGACGGGTEPVAERSPTVAGSVSVDTEPPDAAESPVETSGGYDAEELIAALKAALAENRSAHVTMVMGEAPRIRGEGDLSFEKGATAMQMTVEAPQMGPRDPEVRLVDGVMYMAIPPMTPPGKFIKVDPNDETSPFGGLGRVTQGDPLEALEAFDAGLEDVTYVGGEPLDGEDVDHYVLTVDTTKAAEAQGQAPPPGARAMTYDLWIDGNDLIRKMQFGSGAASLTITMSDWGKPVTVEKPKASAIMQLPQMPPVSP